MLPASQITDTLAVPGVPRAVLGDLKGYSLNINAFNLFIRISFHLMYSFI